MLLGAYTFGAYAYRIHRRSIRRSAYAARSPTAHNSTRSTTAEFDSGVAVGWHRVPWTLGCYGQWNEATRASHYDALCQLDGRILLAGEHASYIPAWQEGAVLSALDAVRRLHARVMAG